jgi:hypothetical protein
LNRPNKKVVRNILIVTLGVLGLLGLISGILLWFVTRPVSTGDWNVYPITASDSAASGLDAKITALKNDIENASSGDTLVMEINESEATSRLDRYLQQRNVSAKAFSPQVYFGNGTVLVLARVHFGVYMGAAVQVTVKAKDGRADFTVTRLDLGKLTIPKTLVNNIMTAVEDKVSGRWDELTVTVQNVSVNNGVLTVAMVKK